jgi:heme/copper-type cytochrome/quinol oxidase subunit 2
MTAIVGEIIQHYVKEAYRLVTKPSDDTAEEADTSLAVEALDQFHDASVRGQLNFQTPATQIMEKIVDLHHDLMFFIVVIVIFVSWMLGRLLHFYHVGNTATPRVAFAHHTRLEQI